MKITIITSSMASTGPGFVAQELANNFVIMGHKVNFLALSKTNSDIITLESSVDSYVFDFKGARVSKKDIRIFEKKLLSFQPDVVISNGIRSDYINSHLSNTYLRVSISHNNPFRDYSQQYGLIKGTIMAIFQMLQFRKIDRVVTLNPALKKMHSIFLKKSKVKLILNGVPGLDRLSNKADAFFGNVATFNKRKNQIIILQAMCSLKSDKIIFWGEGSEKHKLMDQFKSSSIIWNSFEKDKSRIFSSFEIFISTSNSEGLPLSVLEAISVGMPLILSDIPAHRYIASFLPKHTYKLVTSKAELIAGMKYFNQMKDEIPKMNEELKSVFNDNFTSLRMAKDYIYMIESVNEL